MKNANYRKHNDRSQSSSTYHKKDGTPTRALLKREAQEQVEEWAIPSGANDGAYDAADEGYYGY